MASSAPQSKPTTTELADLSALADGTLDPARRAEVEAHISGSPELSALYERERRIVSALHQARESERAPAGLRARIEANRPGKRTVAPIPGLLSNRASRYRKAARIGPFLHLAAFADAPR